jgi:hypothetical protein
MHKMPKLVYPLQQTRRDCSGKQRLSRGNSQDTRSTRPLCLEEHCLATAAIMMRCQFRCLEILLSVSTESRVHQDIFVSL